MKFFRKKLEALSPSNIKHELANAFKGIGANEKRLVFEAIWFGDIDKYPKAKWFMKKSGLQLPGLTYKRMFNNLDQFLEAHKLGLFDEESFSILQKDLDYAYRNEPPLSIRCKTVFENVLHGDYNNEDYEFFNTNIRNDLTESMAREKLKAMQTLGFT